jgi:ribosome-associated translation inhibitor RaiA
MHLNIHMGHQVDITLNTRHTYQDLQLAVWQQALLDTYDHVQVHIQQVPHTNQAQVSIQFNSLQDLVHWRMSQPDTMLINTSQWQNSLYFAPSWKVAGSPQPLRVHR